MRAGHQTLRLLDCSSCNPAADRHVRLSPTFPSSIPLPSTNPHRSFFYVDKLVTRWREEINRRLAVNKAVPAGTKISWTDTYVLAGASAVVATGGPASLWDNLKVGRADWATRADNTLRLPIRFLNFNGLSCTFLNMGFTLQVWTGG